MRNYIFIIYSLFCFQVVSAPFTHAGDLNSGPIEVELKPVASPGGHHTHISNYESEALLSLGGKQMLVRRRDDEIQFDSNMDGIIGPGETTWFKENQTVQITVPWHQGKTIPYRLRIRDRYRYEVETCLSGTFGGRVVYITDANDNGIFGEIQEDYVYIGKEKNKYVHDDFIPLSDYVRIDGKIMEIEYKEGKLIVQPYRGPVSRVRINVPEKLLKEDSEFSVRYWLENIDNGYEFCVKSKDSDTEGLLEVDAIPGKYKVALSEITLNLFDKKKERWTVKTFKGNGSNTDILIPEGDFGITASRNLSFGYTVYKYLDRTITVDKFWLQTPALGEYYSLGQNDAVMSASLVSGKTSLGKIKRFSYG